MALMPKRVKHRKEQRGKLKGNATRGNTVDDVDDLPDSLPLDRTIAIFFGPGTKRGRRRREAREAALRNIKSMVALYEIAEAEGVEVTEEDFEKEAQTMSKALGMEADLISRYMTLSDQSSTYADRLLRTKTLDVILDNAKVTDKELSRGELDEEDSDDEGTGE